MENIVTRLRNLRVFWGSVPVAVCALVTLSGTSQLYALEPVKDARNSLDLNLDDLAFSGVVVVAKNGRITATRTVGYANWEFKVPVDLDTRFKLHSLSKPLLAVVTMRAVESEKLLLSAKVTKYLNPWPDAWQDVTVQHLLGHTSGVPDIAESFLSEWSGDLEKTWEKVYASTTDFKLQSVAGERHQYCNVGFVILARILEIVYDLPISEIFARELFSRCKMGDAGLETTPDWESLTFYDGPSVVSRLAQGYNGGTQAMQVAHSKMYAIPGAGGIYATAGDLVNFTHSVFEGKVLSKELVRQMTTAPATHETPYALGWVIRNRHGHRVFGHTGGTNGFVTSLDYYPDLKTTIVILSNFGFCNMREVRDRVAKSALGL